MCMNPSKFSFGVRAGKFLGFMITRRRIKVNPCEFHFIIKRSFLEVVITTRKLIPYF